MLEVFEGGLKAAEEEHEEEEYEEEEDDDEEIGVAENAFVVFLQKPLVSTCAGTLQFWSVTIVGKNFCQFFLCVTFFPLTH